ncbi:MAG: transcription antitermination factor NusB [Candidatus Paracaedibacteraceae bacterium]|nr:transcription antitermination factor NusB [Candidatus Paracaedibacteraceae bacterium]
MTNSKTTILKGRSAARLAAVQAMYQIDIEPTDPRLVIGQFISLRFKKPEQYYMKNPDLSLFETVVIEALNNKDQYDKFITQVLSKDWTLDRLEVVLKSILRCGICELDCYRETPKAVIINEYVNLTKTFYDGQEPGFINASLDKLAQILER